MLNNSMKAHRSLSVSGGESNSGAMLDELKTASKKVGAPGFGVAGEIPKNRGL
jgi:hypothetical protein